MIAAVVAGIAGLLPWHRSGAVERSGIAIVRSAERLGFIPDGPASWAVATWRALPVLAATAVLAEVLGHVRSAAVLASVGGVVAVAVGGVVLAAPGARWGGPGLSVAAGAVALGAGAVAFVSVTRSRRAARVARRS